MNIDLVIIGSGTAAMVAAFRVRAARWTVAIVDEKPFGGTCALRGCDPKKMLIPGAEVIDGARRTFAEQRNPAHTAVPIVSPLRPAAPARRERCDVEGLDRGAVLGGRGLGRVGRVGRVGGLRGVGHAAGSVGREGGLDRGSGVIGRWHVWAFGAIGQ